MRRNLKEQAVLNNMSTIAMSSRGEILSMTMNATDRGGILSTSREQASRTRPGHIR
ncbi:hypothetical protein [Gorillibacterium massiliense]|uniref:hypothetical protein n=1 Tax=Gorillibacterium massiliense TaxID=1280390 RepID=UPI0012DBFCEB|nr:hypothetical protein [Gorillibacterium massiliense]